ncbi:MAG: class I SAM-dependent methyltransferase [Myxococcaceae bacterium]
MTPPACNVCGGELTLRFKDAADPDSRERFDVLGCARCGLGHTQPVPKDLSRYYMSSYHGGRHGITARYCAWRRVRWIHRLAPRPGTVLDVGCGEGTFLLALKKRGWRPFGTELNPERAHAAGLSVAKTLDALPAEARFDVITLWHSLEHLPDPFATLRDLTRRLSPEGVIVIAVPNAMGFQAQVFGKKWLHLDVPRHLFHFGPLALAKALRKAGLTIEKRWNMEFEYDWLGIVQSAINLWDSEPNGLFRILTGRGDGFSGERRFALLTMGFLLGLPALLLTWLFAAIGDGGTVVMAAKRPTH